MSRKTKNLTPISPILKIRKKCFQDVKSVAAKWLHGISKLPALQKQAKKSKNLKKKKKEGLSVSILTKHLFELNCCVSQLAFDHPTASYQIASTQNFLCQILPLQALPGAGQQGLQPCLVPATPPANSSSTRALPQAPQDLGQRFSKNTSLR